MAETTLPPSSYRVTWQAAMLLGMVGAVDSYHSQRAVAESFNEAQMALPEDERSALHLVMRGLSRLFPFNPERDYPHLIQPRKDLR